MHRPHTMTTAELRALRESLGLSLRAFAAAVGVGERTVDRWERGDSRPARRHVARIEALCAYTEAAVERLTGQAVILTYRTTAEFHDAEPPEGWVLPASWHRQVAWRAAQETGAVIRYRARQ